MRVAVMGAGGIGSYLGALLAESGVDVTLVCRGAHLAAIRERGLKVSTPKAEFSLQKVAATADPAAVGPVDVVIQSVKLYDLAAASQQMLPMVGPRTMVLPIQNGVTAPEEVGAIVGRDHVVGALVYLNAALRSPGVVSCRSEMNTLFVGDPYGGVSGRVLAFRDCCVAAGIDARASDDIRAEQWRKFGPVLKDPALRALYRQSMREVAALAAAKGIRLEADIAERMLALAERYQYDARVSMLEDLEAGKPLELEWLSGYVSREAARVGVPVPFHDMAYACLKPLARSGR